MIKQANGADAVNFRKMAESMSFDLDKDNAIKVSQVINPVDGPDKNPFEKFSSGKWGQSELNASRETVFDSTGICFTLQLHYITRATLIPILIPKPLHCEYPRPHTCESL